MRVTVTRLPESPNDALAVVVRALREKRGESQVDLAKRLQWSQTRLSKLEKGTQAWDVVDIWNVAAAFDIRPSELVRRAGAVLAQRRRGFRLRAR
jgi:transcriptional regulator with XRE-family HTH domain